MRRPAVREDGFAAPERAQHHVVGQVHVADQTHAQAVLRHEREADAHLGDAQRVLPQQLLAAAVVLDILDASRLHRLQPGDGFQQLLLPAARDPGDSEDLSRVGRKADVLQLQNPVDAPYGQAFHLDARLRVHGVGPLDVQHDRMTDHHVGHFLGVGFGRGHVADELPVAQDRHPVRQLLHLVHLVRDDDHGLAVVAHVAQDGKQLFGLLRGEHGGRLVQDQNVRAAVEHLDDLHGLLLGDGHVIDLLIRVDLESVGAADFADLLRRGLQIQLSGQTEHDVLGGGEHVYQLEVLVDHADAQVKGVLGRADHDLFSVDGDGAFVREIDTRQHVHQCRFAAAVFAQQRQDLAPVDVQPDPVVGQHRAEALGDIPHLNGGDFVVQGSTLLS